MTSLMRQRALAKKLAKLSAEADATAPDEGKSKASDAKKRARERLLKQKQEECAKVTAELETQEAKRKQEEVEKLREARLSGVSGWLEACALVVGKWQSASMEQAVVNWVEKFGEVRSRWVWVWVCDGLARQELALMELEEEERQLLAEVGEGGDEADAEESGAQEAAPPAADAEPKEIEAVEEAEEAEPEADELAAELGEIEGALAAAAIESEELDQAIPQADMSPEELQAECTRLREQLKTKADAVREMNTELLELNQECLASKQEIKTLETELTKAQSNQGGNQDQDSKEREQKIREYNKDIQQELAESQRQILRMRQELDEAQEGGTSKVRSPKSPQNGKSGDKLKEALAVCNQELSGAQFKVLHMREVCREVLKVAEEMNDYEQDEENQEWIESMIKKLAKVLKDTGGE